MTRPFLSYVFTQEKWNYMLYDSLYVKNLEKQPCGYGYGKQSGCLGMRLWFRKNGLQRNRRKSFGVIDSLCWLWWCFHKCIQMSKLIKSNTWKCAVCYALIILSWNYKKTSYNYTLKKINITTCKLSLNNPDLKRAYGNMKYGHWGCKSLLKANFKRLHTVWFLLYNIPFIWYSQMAKF